MKVTVKVLGMKSSKGDYEGKPYDSTKVYVETKLDESKGTQKGFAAAEYAIGLSGEYDKFKHLAFPLMAEVEFEQITNGRDTKTVISEFKPVTVPQKQAA